MLFTLFGRDRILSIRDLSPIEVTGLDEAFRTKKYCRFVPFLLQSRENFVEI